MPKKAKITEPTLVKKGQTIPIGQADFAPLLLQLQEVQALIDAHKILTGTIQKKLNSLINGFTPPNNLSLIQLSVVPKLINAVQACWSSILENDSYATGGKNELHTSLEVIFSNLNIYTTK